MSEVTNLWPDFTIEKVRTPKTVLKEQAALLGERTRNLILGEVVSDKVPLKSGKEVISEELYLVVPSLGNYRYRLVELYHEPALVYPLFEGLYLSEGMKSNGINDENDLTKYLSSVFTNTKTKTIIQSLLAQAMES
ncbi:MAG: hypothetical protein U5N85_08525 [Arcicella sp.]|nr:hypothetical protein [Arcicella sp.]